jgi:hypothetical protein
MLELLFCLGEVAEWFIAPDLKSVRPHGLGGSNPPFSVRNTTIPYAYGWLTVKTLEKTLQFGEVV